MSCRVLKRGMEQAMITALASAAGAQGGIRTLRGRYLPTPKNAMVRELYGTLGFTLVSAAADGSSLWELPLDSFRPLPCAIAVNGAPLPL